MKTLKTQPQENNFDLNKLLFLEVATVSSEKSLSDLKKKNPEISEIFLKSNDLLNERFNDDLDEESLYENYAGIYPEFGKIACVSLGALNKDGNIKITSFDGDEKDILLKVRTVLDTAESRYILCGHNIKSFDIPYLGKRYLINGLKPPKLLPTYETKPWEVKAIDTRDIWTFGGFKSFSSLNLISNLLGIKSSSKIKGEEVNQYYWKNDFSKIKDFCESEIKMTIEIIKKLNSNE